MDACLAHQCPAFVGLFHEQACYDVPGFLVVSLGPDRCAERQHHALSWIQGLLPSTSPYDITKDGPTSVNANYGDTHGNTTGSLLWVATTIDSCMFVKEIKSCRHTCFDSSMHVATTSALTWCIVVDLVLSLSTSLLWQLPETYSLLHACFRILEAGVPEDLWIWFCSSPWLFFSHSSRSSSWRA